MRRFSRTGAPGSSRGGLLWSLLCWPSRTRARRDALWRLSWFFPAAAEFFVVPLLHLGNLVFGEFIRLIRVRMSRRHHIWCPIHFVILVLVILVTRQNIVLETKPMSQLMGHGVVPCFSP